MRSAPMPAALASGYPVLIVARARRARLGGGAKRRRDHRRARVARAQRRARPQSRRRRGGHRRASGAVVRGDRLEPRVRERRRRSSRRSGSSGAFTSTRRRLPVLLGARPRGRRTRCPSTSWSEVEGYIWVPEDSAAFIAGRIDAAARRYLDTVLPPFFGALANFAGEHEYSWHTPGHTGGTAFMKSAVGRAFLAFYGEQMLRSDLSVSVGELGSLNDHSGPIAEAERYAARVFGADHTYFSIGGSSASNEIILHSAVADGDIVLVDRNCHKSLNYALNMSGAIPVYLKPRRNARGVIGPVPASELEPEEIRRKIEQSPLVKDKSRRPVLAVLTNSTYDGLCYDVEHTTRVLSRSVDRIHYDEAWYAYARFNPIYEGRYGMHRGRALGGRRHRHGDALHAQAAGRALPGVDDPHPLRARPRRARPLQRGVHDAHLDVAAVQHHRLDRRVGEDDGRRGPGADGRVHPRGDRLPPRHAAARPRAAANARPTTGGSRPGRPTRRAAKPFVDADPDLLATFERRLAAEAGRRLARLRRPRRALLHARPDQGHHAHAGRRARRQAPGARAFPPRS